MAMAPRSRCSAAAGERIDADSLVLATTNVPERELADELGAPAIGDAIGGAHCGHGDL